MSNKNFLEISLNEERLDVKDFTSQIPTKHLKSRQNRYKKAIDLNANANIDKSFIVDKGHKDGKEIHGVSERAVIFILNKETRRFITVLLARPGQVKRLYNACNLEVPDEIMHWAEYYILNGYNHI